MDAARNRAQKLGVSIQRAAGMANPNANTTNTTTTSSDTAPSTPIDSQEGSPTSMQGSVSPGAVASPITQSSSPPPGSPSKEYEEVSVTGERTLTMSRPSADTPLGMVIDNLCLVTSVEEGSPAGVAGVVPGMRVLRVSGVLTTTLDQVRGLAGKVGDGPFEIMVSDPGLLAHTACVASVSLSQEEYEALKLEHQKANHKIRDAVRLEARSAKALLELKGKQAESQKFYETKAAETRQLAEAIGRSPAAQRILALDKRLADAKALLSEDEVTFQQTLSALKLGIKKASREKTSLQRLLGDITEEEDVAEGTKISTDFASSSAEGMRLSIELHQLEEQAATWRAQLAFLEAQDSETMAVLEENQTQIKEKDERIKKLTRIVADLEEENAALVDAKKELREQYTAQQEERNATTKQLSAKVKNVDHDKDTHLAQANQLLSKVQGEETATSRKLREAMKEFDNLTKTAESLARDTNGMRAEEQNLLNTVDEHKKRVQDLRLVKKRWMEAETQVAATSDEAAKARRSTATAFERHNLLQADARRITNLLAERHTVFETAISEAIRLDAALETQEATLERCLPLEGLASSLEEQIDRVEGALELEMKTAASFAHDVVARKAVRDAAEERCGAVQIRLSRLHGQALLVAEGLDIKGREIDSLREEHTVELEDLKRDADITQRKCERKEHDLEEQLAAAIESAQVSADSLRTLETRFGEEAGMAFIFVLFCFCFENFNLPKTLFLGDFFTPFERCLPCLPSLTPPQN